MQIKIQFPFPVRQTDDKVVVVEVKPGTTPLINIRAIEEMMPGHSMQDCEGVFDKVQDFMVQEVVRMSIRTAVERTVAVSPTAKKY